MSKVKETSKTPALDTFGRNLTQLAQDGKLEPVIGRDDEIRRLMQVLGRKKKNNPVLVGDPGVGKTAIVEGLALKIVEGEVPTYLANKRVYELILSSVVAGSKYRGEFEARMQKIMQEIMAAEGQIIVFIDEIHTIIGAGSASGSLDGANIMKPGLARGDFSVIGATTFKEFRESIEKDGAFSRRFEKIVVDEPDMETTETILNGAIPLYEQFHKVRYPHNIRKLMLRLAARYLPYKKFPDKAFDIVDEVGSKIKLINLRDSEEIKALRQKVKDLGKKKIDAVKSQNFEEAAVFKSLEDSAKEELYTAETSFALESEDRWVEAQDEDVYAIISKASGVPVDQLSASEREKIIHMKAALEGSIKGQDSALQKVTDAILRSKAGLQKKTKPIGTFLFLGPTGVGKTQTAKVLAKEMFGSEEALIRFDMSEFSEPHAAATLVGAPPGYVGYEEGGKLTEAVKNKPYAVVLFDEIEKAHDSVLTTLLSLLDEGHLTDKLGRKVSFKHTVIIMTSNIGARSFSEIKSIGFNKMDMPNPEAVESMVMADARRSLRPEFLNRLDNIVIYQPLSKDTIREVVGVAIQTVHERLAEQNKTFELTASATEHLVEKGWDIKYGARPLERLIEQEVVQLLAIEILQNPDKTHFILDSVDTKFVLN